MLKHVKSKSIVGSNKSGTVTNKKSKTSCHVVIRSHFSLESPIDGYTLRSKNFLDLLPLPLDIPLIVTVEPLAPHLHESHDHNTRQMIIINYNHESAS